jgi:hypothetical protein
MKRIIVLLILMMTASAYAGTGLAFLEIPVGARESALGGAGVALVTGPTSAIYNPATLAFTKRGVALMHTKHYGDTKAEFIGVTLRAGRFYFSPHYWGTRISDIEYRIGPTQQPISTFDAVNSAVGGSVAYKANENLSFGLTGHYLYQKIQIESSDGWSLDAGASYKPPVDGLLLGLAVNHLGHVNEFVTEKPKLPTTLRGGASYKHSLHNLGHLLVTAEGLGIYENSPQFKGGIEYCAPDYVALRVGYVTGLEAQGISLGLGLFFKQFHLDYAFIPYKEELGEGHRFSLGLDL